MQLDPSPHAQHDAPSDPLRVPDPKIPAFGAPNGAKYKMMSPAKLPISRSPCLTVPPGLSPGTLLESPVLLTNIKAEPSPTTGTFLHSFVNDTAGSNSAYAPSKTYRNSAHNDGSSSDFEFKPHVRTSSRPGFSSFGHSAAVNPTQQEQESSRQIQSQPQIQILDSWQIVQTVNTAHSASDPPIETSPSEANVPDEVAPDELQQIMGSDNGMQALQSDNNRSCPSAAVDKSSEDGYNWRKYGQKHVKGSEFPRSYYKCTHPNCQMKKQLERSHDGQITEIIYKGQHDHPKPEPSRRLAVGTILSGQGEESSDRHSLASAEEKLSNTNQMDPNANSELSPISPSDDDPEIVVGSNRNGDEVADDDDPESKRRKLDNATFDASQIGKTNREPRVVVQTISEVDILEQSRERERVMGRSSGSSPSLFSSLLHLVLSLSPLFFLSTSEQTPFKEVSLANPVVEFVPLLHPGYSCERMRVIGTSRLNLKLYASLLHVELKASDMIPERLKGKIEVCLHRNVSMGICQCESDNWETLQKGQWSAVISPYEERYTDIKSKEKLPGSVTVTVEEEFQQWRLICLGFGFLLLILAPIVSTWVPFYVCSSMAVGVLGIVLVLAFQLMKLLPMGKKNILYITLYGSVLGVGSYIMQYFSTVVNSVLVNFGLSEEMHYPVSVMLLVLLVLTGAALGYWIVRKYVISEDGNIDANIAHFVKWAMRVLGVVSVLQSSLDVLLPVIALGVYGCICFLLKKWQNRARFQLEHSGNKLWQPRTEQACNLRQPRAGKVSNLWQPRTWQASASSSRRTEFLTRSHNNNSRSAERSSSSPYGQSNQRLTAAAQTYSYPRQRRSAIQEGDYYSSFHRTPVRKFSRTQWDDFTRESTREAMVEWASSPEFTRWIADNTHRIRVDPEPNSDDSEESSSNSSDETVVENGNNRFGLFNWY